jgi:hypothetical protein
VDFAASDHDIPASKIDRIHAPQSPDLSLMLARQSDLPLRCWGNGGGVVMATISNPAASIAVVVALFLSGIGTSLPIDSARAHDTCAAAPGADPPDGQHWYYRTDRMKQRKCWYLRAAEPSTPQPAADTSTPAGEPASTQPAANPAGEPASAKPAAQWCAYFTGGPTNCDFASFQDCLVAIKGKTALCVENAQNVPPARSDPDRGS